MPEARELHSSPTGQAESRRILIVDDDPEMRSLLVKALSSSRRQVQQACDGGEAIEQLRSAGAFDLIISDIRMPNHDGHAVLQMAHETNPATKVILITAFGEIDEYLDTMDRGAYEYLNKPVRLADLMQIVDRALSSVV